ncbi:hypothetical protein JB92DRAFT_1687270 [Gautieria morchelliformis]|nr:hypothetical protein JB92DRAFT_1687270 [Gautieria morchelliformis]
MGLAGRKTKQRLGADPRNLTWSDDSSKFGAKYLQSLGWTAGTGLGVSGEGRTSNLKVHQKLDLMGIGANRHAPEGDDAGWRGGREFERLLARLNQAQADTPDIPVDDGDATGENGSAKGVESIQQLVKGNDDPLEPNVNGKEGNMETKGDGGRKQKRKRSTTEDEEIDAKEAKRRRKEEKKRKKEQRKAEKATKRPQTSQNFGDGSGEHVSGEPVQGMRVPRYRAHRARNLASKRQAAASVTGMNEILGITSSTASSNSSPVNNPPQKLAVRSDASYISGMDLGGLGFRCPTEQEATQGHEAGQDGKELLRKSGKSVGEYFAEKMRMRGVGKTPALT